MQIKTKRSIYHLIPELGVIVNNELLQEYQHLLPSYIDEKAIINRLGMAISDEGIDFEINSIRNITLNLTEDCNYRCGYCIYSGKYKNVRTHTRNRMEMPVAKKAIEFIIEKLKSNNRKIKANSFNLGFYGGEALLEFQLIKDIVIYAENRFKEEGIEDKFKLNFSMTTNGFLLNTDVTDYLVEKKFIVDVSLDGPAEEHDKYRVTSENKPTWNVVWQNLMAVKEKYPDFYKDNINFFCTLHPGHNYALIDEFFMNHKEFFDLSDVSVFYINRTLLKETANKEFNGFKSQPFSKINMIKTVERLDDKLKLKKLTCESHFTMNCFPGGAKPFVASDGKLHICERVKPDLPIGDVFNGIDYNAVRRIQTQWNQEIIRLRCWECPAWSFCNICMARSEENGGVSVKCNYKDYFINELQEYLEYKEAEQEKKEDDAPPLDNTDVRGFVASL